MVSAFSVPKSKRGNEYFYLKITNIMKFQALANISIIISKFSPETSPKIVKESDPKYR
jgi:hypothetical protein